jgi:hypothetical protein
MPGRSYFFRVSFTRDGTMGIVGRLWRLSFANDEVCG